MMITPDQAAKYFEHPSQRLYGIDPDNLPGEPFEYWADDLVCGAFYPGPMSGVWMVHVAAKPEGRGMIVARARQILGDFAAKKGYPTVMGWTPTKLRAAIAFAKRVGFKEVGEFFANGEKVTITEWRHECL